MTTAKTAPKKTKDQDFDSRLRIRVQAYDYKVLDESVKQIINTSIGLGAKINGPIPLPTKLKKYTVNRSTFIFKNAREQLEIRIHRRLIDIINPSQRIVEALSNLTLPAGVSVEVRMN